MLFLTHMKAGRFDEAIRVANTMKGQQSDDPLPFIFLGIAYAGKGDSTEARQSFGQALAIEPGNPNAAINLASLEYREGNPGKARSLLKEVITQHPGHVQALLELAAMEAASGNTDAFTARLNTQAIQHNPHNLKPRIVLARYYLGIAQPSRGLSIW